MFFIMLKAFKYRLRPTKRQARILAAHLEECRMLYNHFLVDRIQAYQAWGESLSMYSQCNCLSFLKTGFRKEVKSVLSTSRPPIMDYVFS